MSDTIFTALLLLIVGMVTVFVILTCVVLSGRVVIWLSNKLTPAESESTNEVLSTGVQTDRKKKIAAIAAAVDIVSQGKGRIARINKLDVISDHE